MLRRPQDGRDETLHLLAIAGAFRVRIALRLKGLNAEKLTLDLLKGDQFVNRRSNLTPYRRPILTPLIDGKLDGPAILTGGDFGPEASLVALVVVLAAATYLLWLIAKLKCAEPPIWSDVKRAAARASGA